MSIDTASLSGRQRYRLITSLVVPRPIGWISTYSAGGRRNLAPFSYFNALSVAPILVGASIGLRGGSPKDTLSNIRATAAFAVNIVTERHLEAMVRTAGDWAPDVDEFEEAGLVAAEATTVDAPYVTDAAAVFECRLFREVELGAAPNTLIIGEVVAIHLSETLEVDPDTMHVDPASLRPVGRLGLDEYTLLGELRHVPRPRVE
ncbi:MAG: flavin reductase family protein [Longimicrobiales bacterium]